MQILYFPGLCAIKLWRVVWLLWIRVRGALPNQYEQFSSDWLNVRIDECRSRSTNKQLMIFLLNRKSYQLTRFLIASRVYKNTA